MEVYRRVLELDAAPDIEAWGCSAFNCAVLLAAAGREEEAIAAYRSAIAVGEHESMFQAAHNLAQLRATREGLTDEVEALYLFATRSPDASDSSRAWFNLGCEYGNAGKRKKARKAMRMVVKIGTDDPWLAEAMEILND